MGASQPATTGIAIYLAMTQNIHPGLGQLITGPAQALCRIFIQALNCQLLNGSPGENK
jgi:hypothetical protein